jgi:Tol biopolymer transport system component
MNLFMFKLQVIMHRIILPLLIIFALVICSFGAIFEHDWVAQGYTHLNVSPNGQYLLYGIEERGLYCYDFSTKQSLQISDAMGAAMQTQWSADSRYFSFKLLQAAESGFFQTPALFDWYEKRLTFLHQAVMQAGIPSLSETGEIAFTIAETLYISDFFGNMIQSFMLPDYANQTPISADGRYVVYNDGEDRLWIIDRQSQDHRPVSDANKGYFEPRWSADGVHFAATSLDETLTIFNIRDNYQLEIGPGKQPRWSPDGEHLIFSHAEIVETREVLSMNLFMVDKNGQNMQKITPGDVWAHYPSLSATDQRLYFVQPQSGNLLWADFSFQQKASPIESVQELELPDAGSLFFTFPQGSSDLNETSSTAYYFDIPYVHQRYDSPDWFNGNSSCGATSAIQCLTYYDLLEPWPVQVSGPYPHISNYGNYICEIYTYNNYTFNIWANDPNGVRGYGGFGFIVRNGSQAWSDTKGFMAVYASKHGLESWVDWGPSRSKLVNEVNSKLPFVLLNSLTSAGHYISVIGYDKADGTTIIVNDPYGDKNQGYANFHGRRAKYDWPGYNNGYSNLNNVWCYIYFRGGVPRYPELAARSIVNQDSAYVGESITFSATIANYGDTLSAVTNALLVLSIDDKYDEGDMVFGSLNLPGIGQGDSLILTSEVTLPDSLTSNRYYFGILADGDQNNTDMVPENNFTCARLVISGYPDIYSVKPDPETLISDPQPSIYANYRDFISRIDAESPRLFLNGVEMTSQCTFTSRKISLTPSKPLSAGEHQVEVQVKNRDGYLSRYRWTFSVEPTTAISATETKPNKFHLAQNYPNPFNPKTVIRYSLPINTHAELSVYNLLGQKVATLLAEKQVPSTYQVEWDATAFASGIYIYRLQAGHFTAWNKMILKK